MQGAGGEDEGGECAGEGGEEEPESELEPFEPAAGGIAEGAEEQDEEGEGENEEADADEDGVGDVPAARVADRSCTGFRRSGPWWGQIGTEGACNPR